MRDSPFIHGWIPFSCSPVAVVVFAVTAGWMVEILKHGQWYRGQRAGRELEDKRRPDLPTHPPSCHGRCSCRCRCEVAPVVMKVRTRAHLDGTPGIPGGDGALKETSYATLRLRSSDV